MALSAVAKALLMSLQVKVLMIGEILLHFQTLHRIVLARGVMLLVPVAGISTVLLLERCLKIAFAEPNPSLAGVHLRMSLSVLSTVGVFMM